MENNQFDVIRAIRETLKNPKDFSKAIDNLITENNELKKKIESLESIQLAGIGKQLLQKTQTINAINFIGEMVEVSNADALKKIYFDLKSALSDHVIVLCANVEGKAYVAIGISDTVAAAKNLDAGKIIKEQISGLIKGGGGGQKNLATAGGQDTKNLKEVIEKVKGLL